MEAGGILKGFVLPQYPSKNTPLSGDFKRKCVSAKKVTFGGVRKPRYRKGCFGITKFPLGLRDKRTTEPLGR